MGPGPLAVRCLMDGEGRITRKSETTAERYRVYDYEYDADGHLFRVFRNELLLEQYRYTDSGQRLIRSNGWPNESVKYFYGDDDGCLYVAASVPVMLRFEYDEAGSCTLREEDYEKTTRYLYEGTRLRRVVLPDGTRLSYRYDPKSPNPQGPVVVYRGPAGKESPVLEYAWKDATRLAACLDRRTGLRYDFAYNGNALARVRLRGHAVGRLLRTNANDAELFAGCDQVNTPKVFTDKSGREVKWIEYDSFGIVLDDSTPELFIPVGFAGGLLDRDTGFVRFGFRDYDPSVGRFTCPDPLGDTGGDHDLYDYCVDDPVNMHDPLGLFGMSGLSQFLQQQGLKERATEGIQKSEPSPPGKYYTEQKRPLDGVAGHFYSVPIMHHSQFVDSEGKNFGRFSDGIRKDSEKNMQKYEPSSDEKKYDGELIDDAREQYMEGKEKINEILAELPDEDRWIEDSNQYGLLGQNCQHFTEEIKKIAEDLAKKRGKPLILK